MIVFGSLTPFLIHIHRWIGELCALTLGGGDHRRLIQIEQALDEFVRVLGFDAKGRQSRCREVFFVEGDDDAVATPDRGSQHVAVIWTGNSSPTMSGS